MKRRRRRILRDLSSVIICLGMVFAALIEAGIIKLPEEEQSAAVSTDYVPEDAQDFCVSMIDVGQGDSILITAFGGSLLIDAGETEYGDTVTSFIKDAGIDRLSMIIVTHPHSDHIGGMARVVEEIGADKIIIPRLPDDMVPTTRAYESFLTAVKNSGGKLIAARAGNRYVLGTNGDDEVILSLLSPSADADFSDMNDWSVCVRADYKNVSWLFTGDLSEEGEKALMESGADIDVSALKVGHHGSAYSSSAAFLERVTPRLCVISCGKDNSYGHPAQETLERLKVYTNSIYRTDEKGNIRVYSDGSKLYVAG